MPSVDSDRSYRDFFEKQFLEFLSLALRPIYQGAKAKQTL